MKLSAVLSLVLSGASVTSALRTPTNDDVRDVFDIIITEIEASACPSDPHSVDFHSHWDRNGLSSIILDGDGKSSDDVSNFDCVLYPRAKGPRPMAAKLIRLAHADASGIADGFVNLADRANNGGLESAVFLLDALYESGIQLDSSGAPIDEVISKADLYAWSGAFAAEYAASFSNYEQDGDADNDVKLPEFDLKWGRKTYEPLSDTDRGPIETFVPASAGWARVADYFRTKFGFDERQAATLMGAHSLGSAMSATVPPFSGYWTVVPEAFDSMYYAMLSSPVPIAVTCSDPFDPKTCEELPGCTAHFEPQNAGPVLKSAALREEDGGGRCHGWEQIKVMGASTGHGGYQWSHSCDQNGDGCNGLMLNVDVSMQYDIDHYVDGTTGEVTGLPEGSICGDYVKGMRFFLRCFDTKAENSGGQSPVVEHRDDSTNFLQEFASVYDKMMTVNVDFTDGQGLYEVGDASSPSGTGTGSSSAVDDSIPNNARCPLDTESSNKCYFGPTSGNPFLCLGCHSGTCGIDSGDDFPTCREKGWKPANPPPAPTGPKAPPSGAKNTDTDTLDECPVDTRDPDSGCFYKRGSSPNPFVCFHCKSNICGLDIAGNYLCRPEGWSAKHAALPPTAPTVQIPTGLKPVAVIMPCPFQTDNAYDDCYRTENDFANPFSCHGCESNVCGVSSDGQALCRDDWWCPGDDEAYAPPPAPVNADGKVHLEGSCPLQSESNLKDCFLDTTPAARNPFMCDGCASGVCGVDHYGDARCRPLGWQVHDLIIGEMCPVDDTNDDCVPKDPAHNQGHSPFSCDPCETGYCGIDHYGDPRCVEPGWRKTDLPDGELCPFEDAGCMFDEPSGWPCQACESKMCVVEENGDARCSSESGVPSGGGKSGGNNIADGQLCDLDESNKNSGCYYDGSRNPFYCTSCISGECGVDADVDAVCVPLGWKPGQAAAGANVPPRGPGDGTALGRLCDLDESDKNSGCYYDGTRNPFTCRTCKSGVCGVDEEEDAVCVPVGWDAGSHTKKAPKATPSAGVPLGKLCDLDESGQDSGCYYDGKNNPFTCRSCASAVCGVDDDFDAVCVDIGWKAGDPAGPGGGTSGGSSSTNNNGNLVAKGKFCEIDESNVNSGCYYDGRKNPFKCLSCETAVCGVDADEEAVCVDVGWSPGQKTPGKVSAKVAEGRLCDLDESSKDTSGCYYDGAKNPFDCDTCVTGTCGVDDDFDAVCVKTGWKVAAPTGKAIAGTVPLGRLCDLDESSENSGCFYNGRDNPFTCLTCGTAVCGVDEDEDAICVPVDWTPSDDSPKPLFVWTPDEDEGDDPNVPRKVPLGRLCDLDESGAGSGCFYDGKENPFKCDTCASGKCGVDSEEDAVCVKDTWVHSPTELHKKPSPKHDIYVPLGQLCDLDESAENSGCYYDGSKNPFTCRTCKSGVCGVDADLDGVCVDVAWTPGKDTKKPELVWTGGEGKTEVVVGVNAVGKLCDLDESGKDSGCYYDGTENPFTCHTCETGVCGVDGEEDAVCVEVGYKAGSAWNAGKGNNAKKQNDNMICPVSTSDPASGCYFKDMGANPFLCLGCDSGVCGVDHFGDALCRGKGWTFEDLVDGELCPFMKEGCLFSPDNPNPWHCVQCDSGYCGEDENGDAKCVKKGWSRYKLPVGGLCPFRDSDCLFKEGGPEPWSCDACDSGWCNVNTYGDAQCFKHSPDTPVEELQDMTTGEFCPYHQTSCHVSDSMSNPWKCDFCKSGFCGEDMDGNAQCRPSQWKAPKLPDGEQCPFKAPSCLFEEGGPQPWSCEACESGHCNINTYGDAECTKHSTNMAPSELADLVDGEFCPYHQEHCQTGQTAADSPNPWECTFCSSGYCGEDAQGDAQCRSPNWSAPKIKDGEQCPYRKGGCKFDEIASPLTWSCDACESGSCGQDSFGEAKCVKQGGFEPKLIELEDGEFCPYHQEGCHTTDDSSNPWECKFCRSGYCGEDAQGDAQCRGRGWNAPPAPAPVQLPQQQNSGQQNLGIGDLCPFEDAGCMFSPDGPVPWPCSECTSGFCGEDHYGDAKCVEEEWAKVDLKVGSLCPLNLADEEDGCYYDNDEKSRPFLCEACETNMCGVDSTGKALCREKGWKPAGKVRGRALLNSSLD